MIKYLVVFLSLCIRHGVSTYKFIDDAGRHLQTQVNMIPELQSELKGLNDDILVPVTAKNSDFLKSLRQIQSVIDGDSEIHRLITKNNDFMNSLSVSDLPNAVTKLQGELTATKSDLISKHEKIRSDLESVSDDFDQKINSIFLPNFTSSLVNMTSDSIRNVSRSIRAIAQFRNETYGNNSSDIDPNIIFSFAPRQGRDMIIQKNILEKNTNDLRRLESDTVPQSLSAINTTVREYLATGVSDINTILSSSEKEAEEIVNSTAIGNSNNLDSLINTTRIDLSSQVSTQVTEINRVLSEMNATVLAYSNLKNRTGNLLKALKDQLKSVADAKRNALVNSVYPITNGLGESIVAARKDLEDSWDAFSTRLRSTSEDMRKTISKTEEKSVKNYTNQLEIMYSNLTKSVDEKIANLISDGTVFVESVKTSLSGEVAKMVPQSESLSSSISALMAQTSELLKTAQQLMFAKMDSIETQNGKLFSHTNNTFVEKLKSLRAATETMNSGFDKTRNELDEFLKTSLNKFDLDTNASISNLTRNFQESVERFQNNLVAWPIVDANELGKKVAEIESSVNTSLSDATKAEKSIDLIGDNFSQKTSGIPDSFVHDSAIVTDLSSKWHQQLDAAGAFLRAQVTSEIISTKSKNDYIGDEISKIVKTITDQFGSMNSMIDENVKRGPDPPTMESIQTVASQVGTSVQSNADRLNDVVNDLKNEFSRNVSREDATLKSFFDTELAAIVDKYQSVITRDMSGSNLASDIASLMSQLSSNLTYSSDLSAYKQSIQTASANLGTLEAEFQDETEEITTAANNLDSLVNITIVPAINSEISRVALLSDKTLNQSAAAKIKKLSSSSNLNLDKKVNETKDAILSSLRDQFRTTLDSLSDYLNHVSGGSSGLSSEVSLIQHETKSAAIQLHNLTKTNERMMYDSGKMEKVEEEKSEAIWKKLLSDSKEVVRAENQLWMNSDRAFSGLEQLHVANGEEFVRNLTRLGDEILSKIQNLTQSHAITDLENEVQTRSRDSRLRNGKIIQQLRDEGGNLIAGINSTSIESVLGDVGSLSESLSGIGKQIHDVVVSVLKGSNDSRSRMEANEQKRLLETFKQFDEVLMKVGSFVPSEVKRESEQALAYMRESFEDLDELVAAHKFPTMSSDRSLNLIARDELPNIETAIKRSRSSIKDTVKFVKANKSFEEDFKYMRDKIMALKKRQGFKQSQIERIHRYLDRNSNA